MNKQEAIEYLKKLSEDSFKLAKIHVVYIDSIVGVINEIYEPQKVVLPEFVGEWIGYKKAEGYTLYGTLMEAEANPIIKEWVFKSRQEVLALAWIFGYDIEKEEEIDE